ncbi:hypothetical protein OG909_30785 [Streptomyces sp. NBC_01754]|uniref:phosphatase domain-containing protein n=1 Tax=Streptomyces sp. NBC_01754 TaxID=2975930 RepID=UPI002DDAEFBA|nr:hypothetical protein [Streptomyces sp. NBC_01754]WSC96337.1 hypothetical protein OG909_30785 [Streptomyces sp. NBC_01754]
MRDDARPPAVFDLDGTLADAGHRQHFLEGRRDWSAFFAAAVDDPPLAQGVALARSSAEECEVLHLTGRPERCRRDTLAWLEQQGLPRGSLCMRRDDDRRPARHTKPEIPKRLARNRDVRLLVDDDELVCVAAERAGFTVLRARWAASSPGMRDAQEREGRT